MFARITAASNQAHVGVVGLGAGSLAAYRRPEQHWTFYEIDPAVERIAREPAYFTFLPDCGGYCQVVVGDGRLSLKSAPAGHYGIIGTWTRSALTRFRYTC